MKEKEAKQIIESEFGNLKKEDRSQYDTLVSLLVKYGADESRPLNGLVVQTEAEEEFEERMNIYSPKGTKIIFSYPDSGYDGEVKRAKELLELNKEYTVERTSVGGSHTSVSLEEVTGAAFNSVMFSPKK